jgi:hypothetical protein
VEGGDLQQAEEELVCALRRAGLRGELEHRVDFLVFGGDVGLDREVVPDVVRELEVFDVLELAPEQQRDRPVEEQVGLHDFLELLGEPALLEDRHDAVDLFGHHVHLRGAACVHLHVDQVAEHRGLQEDVFLAQLEVVFLEPRNVLLDHFDAVVLAVEDHLDHFRDQPVFLALAQAALLRLDVHVVLAVGLEDGLELREELARVGLELRAAEDAGAEGGVDGEQDAEVQVDFPERDFGELGRAVLEALRESALERGVELDLLLVVHGRPGEERERVEEVRD